MRVATLSRDSSGKHGLNKITSLNAAIASLFQVAAHSRGASESVRSMHMRNKILNLFLLVMLVSSSGCLSRGLIRTAQGKPTDDPFVTATEAPDGKRHPE